MPKRGLSLQHPFGWAITILLIGYFVRMYSLTSAPLGIGGDEIFYYNDAVRILALGDFQIYYPTNYGHEPLFIYAEALTVGLFGHHAFVLRYTAVIGGLLMMAGSYALARRMFGAPVALWTLALFASIFWPVFITRVGLRAFTFPLLTIYSVYALWRALEMRSWRWSVWAGIFNGLTLYTYIASRVFPVVIILWLIALVFLKRAWLSRNVSRLALILGLASVIVLPYLLFALTNPDVVNQRPNTLGGPLFEIQQGNFTGLWQNVVGLAGMFTFRGDTDERYNPFQLPVFDPIIGLLGYAGVLMAVWRWRSPAYALLWIWFSVGLLPSLLSAGAPAWLRLGGSLFPILVLPGLGLEAAIDYLGRAVPPLRRFRWMAATAVLAALLVGVRCLSLFLGPWRTSTEMTGVYESDVYLAAQYLARHPPPPETQVLIMARSASDSDPMMFELQSGLEDRVDWASEMVWPATAAETWFLFTREVLPDELTRTWLGTAPIHIEMDNAGNHLLEIYKVLPPLTAPQPEVVVSAQFTQLVDFLGASYPEPLERGARNEVLLFWRVRPDFTFNRDDWPRLFLRLRDGAKIWAQSDVARLAYPPVEWQANAVWVQRVTLDIPVDAPPIALEPELGVYSNSFIWPATTQPNEPARLTVSLPPVKVIGQPVTTTPLPEIAIQLNAALALQSSKLNTPAIGAQPGLPLALETTWRALAPMSDDGAVQIRLITDAGEVVAETSADVIYAGAYPTSQWQLNEIITSQHVITVPTELASGNYLVQLRYLPNTTAEGAEWLTVAPVTITGRPHLFTQPMVDVPVTAQVGEVADLVGYRLKPASARPGDTVRLILVWRALQTPTQSFKVFVHVYGQDNVNTIYAQKDNEPGDGALPTLGWVPGEYLEDEYPLPLDASLASGLYRIGVGMYDPDTLQRLPIQSDDGQITDSFIIGQLEVKP